MLKNDGFMCLNGRFRGYFDRFDLRSIKNFQNLCSYASLIVAHVDYTVTRTLHVQNQYFLRFVWLFFVQIPFCLFTPWLLIV